MANSGPLIKIAATTAAEVCAGYRLDAEEKKLLNPGQAPLDYLDVLLADDRSVKHAVKFLAYALPKREAVFWGCLALELTDLPPISLQGKQAMQAAANWVVDPNEQTRRAAETAAKEAGPTTPAGSLAAAAFHSGGSVAAVDTPAVDPPPTLTARGVSNAIHLMVARLKAKDVKGYYRRAVAVGIGVAMGKYCGP